MLGQSISLIEVVHELRALLELDVRKAQSALIELLATGQLPPVSARIDGIATKIEPKWWWAASIDYPVSSATFNLNGEERLPRATDIAIDLDAWERLRAQLAATPAARLSAQESMEEYAARRLREMRAPESTPVAMPNAALSAEQGASEGVTQTILTLPNDRTGKRGPRPKRRQEVKNAMLLRLRAGEDLETWKQDALKQAFMASRETCCKALGEALSEFVGVVGIKTPTNTDSK
jgi:hypothetical protein